METENKQFLQEIDTLMTLQEKQMDRKMAEQVHWRTLASEQSVNQLARMTAGV